MSGGLSTTIRKKHHPFHRLKENKFFSKFIYRCLIGRDLRQAARCRMAGAAAAQLQEGLDVLREAFAQVARASEDVHLVIAGPDHGMRRKTESWVSA